MSVEEPRIMKTISTLFKFISCLMFLAGLGGFLINIFVKTVITENPFPELNTSTLILDDKFILLLIPAAIAVYVASEAFLRLKVWAKVFLEFFSWMSLTLLIMAGFFLSTVLTSDVTGELIQGFKTILATIIFLLIAPFIFLIFAIRMPRVKNYFSSGSAHNRKSV